MRKYPFIANCLSNTMSIAIGFSCLTVSAADLSRMITYEHEGQTAYAVSLMADMPQKEVARSAVVILFDTSASQQGEYREAALAALDTLLSGLQPNDQVELMGVDLDVNRLTNGFVAPNSKEMQAAVSELRQQVPLGSTDMAAALTGAVERLNSADGVQRSIVYIGDGISTANLLDTPTLRKTVDQLRSAQASVSSFAVGPRLDSQLLAVLANQSGGNITIQQNEGDNLRNAQLAGKELVTAVKGKVMWPTAVHLPPEMGQSYPSTMPPLRSDRDTILLGTTSDQLPASFDLQITTGERSFAWTTTPEASSEDNGFLLKVIEIAQPDQGLSLPTVGSEGLREVARLVGAQMDSLTQVAERAAAAGDRKSASRIAEAVLRTDPGNVRARTVQNFVESDESFDAPPDVPEATVLEQGTDLTVPESGDIVLVQPQEDLLGPMSRDGEFLDQVEQERRVFAEMLSKEIQNTIINARSRMSTDPQSTIQDLKLALVSVQRAVDLSSEKRAELVGKLRTALVEARHQEFLKDEIDREREESLAAARESKLLLDRLEQRLELQKQLMERFNALIDEQRFLEAKEVAQVVEEIDPDGVTPRVASLNASLKRHHYLQMVARAARQQGFFDTMYQNELSSIPFPDDPPIVYPDAEEWEALTARRQKYASVDLSARSKAEEKIEAALRETLKAPLQYEDQPLNEVINTLIDEYDIPIIFDSAAMEEVAISPDTEISINLRNISLNSALNLILRQPGLEDLTFTIDQEVLLITTEEKANESLKVKVYPVADLVLPIENLGLTGGLGGASGGGLTGGGGGGLGGGGGGLGGGGGGGGLGGGGGGGGGGGLFNVGDDLATEADQVTPSAGTPATTKNAASPITQKSGPDTDWQERFGSEQLDAVEVRQLARGLMKKGQSAEVIAMIQAAIQNGQSQPWMYETLGIAMELEGRPKSDIERAVMSACDFSTSPDQLLLIGQYLSHIGLDSRALEVYRQVTKLPGLHPEAYALGLRTAQRLEDQAGIRWATVGILENSWPSDQQAIYDTAFRVANATLEAMEQSRDPLYAEYREQCETALSRDVVIQVTWSGDADIDLIVEEPGGTVCSLQQPRTPGGGVCSGDLAAEGETPEKATSFTETYTCAQAFPGTYRARLRKIYGDVVADKVIVDIYKHYGTPRQVHERQHLAVQDDSDSMAVFELEDGRRLESLEDQQLQLAVGRQQALSQQILAQQLGGLSDPRIAAARGPGGDNNLARRLALAGQIGAVGFQPIIQTLPDGVQMTATAVISADRRYVRVSAAPSFTGIGNVQTFSFASQVQGGGAGGGGIGGGGGGGIGGGGGGI